MSEYRVVSVRISMETYNRLEDHSMQFQEPGEDKLPISRALRDLIETGLYGPPTENTARQRGYLDGLMQGKHDFYAKLAEFLQEHFGYED